MSLYKAVFPYYKNRKSLELLQGFSYSYLNKKGNKLISNLVFDGCEDIEVMEDGKKVSYTMFMFHELRVQDQIIIPVNFIPYKSYAHKVTKNTDGTYTVDLKRYNLGNHKVIYQLEEEPRVSIMDLKTRRFSLFLEEERSESLANVEEQAKEDLEIFKKLDEDSEEDSEVDLFDLWD